MGNNQQRPTTETISSSLFFFFFLFSSHFSLILSQPRKTGAANVTRESARVRLIYRMPLRCVATIPPSTLATTSMPYRMPASRIMDTRVSQQNRSPDSSPRLINSHSFSILCLFKLIFIIFYSPNKCGCPGAYSPEGRWTGAGVCPGPNALPLGQRAHSQRASLRFGIAHGAPRSEVYSPRGDPGAQRNRRPGCPVPRVRREE